MKLLSVMITLCLSTVLYSQIPLEGKIAGVQITSPQELNLSTDTLPRVVLVDQTESEQGPTYYLNGEHLQAQALRTLNPDQIEAIEVDATSQTIGDKEYHGAIYITTKEGYQPSFITLSQLKEKYIEASEWPVLFLLDDKTIHASYDEFLVDEKYIWRIEVEMIDHFQENVSLQLIRLLTRSKENLERANTIIIRGQEG